MSPVAQRFAAQLDRSELEDFQRAARLLLAHPLVTSAHPRPDAMAAVRRFEDALRVEFSRVLHYRLDMSPTCARLLRRPALLSSLRPARTATGRTFSRWAYTYLCLVLAALESLGAQTSISQLAAEVRRVRAGDESLPVNLDLYDQRRAFVDAVAWLEARGVLTLVDGATEAFLAGSDGDALYDVDADAASRLLVSPPSVLRDVETTNDFLTEQYPPGEAGELARLRHRLARRLVEATAVYYDELPPDELAYIRQRRSRLSSDLERLTGCTVEARAEGLALVDTNVEPLAGDPFPNRGAVAHAALLLAERLLLAAEVGPVGAGPVASGPPRPEGLPVGRFVPASALADGWAVVTGAYRDRFPAEYRAEPDRLQGESLALLERLDLVRLSAGGVVVRPALARFRPDVRLAETPQLSLLEGGPDA
jgi:uncharacterized protein (TIGR02678 family)